MTRKLREWIPFLGLGFAKRRRLSVICGDDLVIGFVDLFVALGSGFWFVDDAPV